MPCQQFLVRDKVFLFRVEKQEIGIITHRNRSFAPFETKAPRNIRSGQSGNGGGIQTCRKKRSDKLLRTHNPAPDEEKVVTPFHRGRTRGVIGAERVDLAALDTRHHVGAHVLRADGRRAFGRSTDGDDIVFVESKIMRARFGSNIDPALTRFKDRIDPLDRKSVV